MGIDDDAQKRLTTLCELLAEESVRAATKALPLGGVVAVTMRISLAGTNGPEPDSVIDRRVGEDIVSAKLIHGATVVVTEHRLIVLSITSAVGMPEDVMFTMPLNAISEIDVGSKRSGLTKMLTMRIRAKDDTELNFEIPKSATKDGQRVIDVLRAAQA